MGTTRRRRTGLLVVGAAGTLLLSTSPLWASYLGRRIEWLTVDRVEISGTRLLAPHEVLAASGITSGQHLLDETAVWEMSLRAHPAIADARITRRPPGTLRIRVTEKDPVALVSDGTLRLATSAGEILPVEPYGVPFDLPVVHGSLTDSLEAVSTRVAVAEVERLTGIAPSFMREVSEVRIAGPDADVLILSHADGEILLPVGVPLTRIDELGRVLIDVQRRFADPDGSGRFPRHRLDLRYDDQIVVRPSLSGDFR